MATNTYEIRLANLRLLIKQWDTVTALAKKLGHSNASYLVQVAGPNPRRKIGERVARDIEETLKLPDGWMDQPHANADTLHVEDEFLHDCIKMVMTCIRDLNLTFDSDKVAKLARFAYKHAKATGAVDKQDVMQLIDIAREKH